MPIIFINCSCKIAYLNFFIDKEKMGANRFSADTGATNREKMVKCENDF